MRWCRLYNDEAQDRRIRYVAASAGCQPVIVLGVLTAMKCHASERRDEQRGTLAGFDTRVVAFDLGIEPPMLMRIKIAMEGHYLDGDRLIDWEKMQYASDGSTERWRKWAEKQRQSKQELSEPPTLAQRLPNDGPTRKNRTEQNRTDISVPSEPHPNAGASGRRAAKADQAGFAEFWRIYPRKIGKGAAEKAWPRAIAACGGDPEPILMGIKIAVSLDRLDMREDGRFCPHASTWLNGKRWLDGMEPEPDRQPTFLARHA